MKVFLVKAGEWESDVRCVCATEEIAEREVLKRVCNFQSDRVINL